MSTDELTTLAHARVGSQWFITRGSSRDAPIGLPAEETTPAQVSDLLDALHDTVLKRYRVAAGSARTIHDYLRPPRLPSLPRFFHPSRLFSLRDPSYTHDSAMEIATGIAPHDSAMEIATGIAPASSRTRRPKLHSPPLNFPLTSTSQITSQNFGREDTDTRLSRTLSSMYIHLSYYYLISRKVSYNMSVQVKCPPTMDI